MEGRSSLDQACDGLERNTEWEIQAFWESEFFFIVGWLYSHRLWNKFLFFSLSRQHVWPFECRLSFQLKQDEHFAWCIVMLWFDGS